MIGTLFFQILDLSNLFLRSLYWHQLCRSIKRKQSYVQDGQKPKHNSNRFVLNF
jgi:hypothetical protein